jgi:hypothetical protein
VYGDKDKPTWEVFGDIESYKVKRVSWKDYENVDMKKIKQKKDEQSHGTVVRLRFRNKEQISILTAYDVYACADNGDTIERF